MKATVQKGGLLLWEDVPDPTLGPNEALVQVHAAGVNRADLAQRAGHYAPPPGASEVLGLEVAGTIKAFGSEGTRSSPAFNLGDEVCALLPGGGYAEQVTVPVDLLIPRPRGWTLTEAAGLPEAFLTAHLNLFREAGLQPGERMLVHGGASGVGTAAIQLAREAGCTVFATAGTPEKVALCERLGATGIHYKEQDFLEAVTGGNDAAGGVDVILDMVGSSYLERNLKALRRGGRLVVIATMGGGEGPVDLRTLMLKRLTLRGSTLRSRPVEEKVALTQDFIARFGAALASRRLGPVIDSVFPITEVEAAHARMRQNLNAGKLILSIPQG